MGSKLFKIQRNAAETLLGGVWIGEALNPTATPIALKISKKSSTDNFLESPRKEAEIMQALGCMEPTGCHPNIIRCLASLTEESKCKDIVTITAMEYARDGDLLSYSLKGQGFSPKRNLHQEWQLPQEAAVGKAIREILEGVQAMHDKGYAHLDISMENSLLIGNRCKICDFGMALRIPPGNVVRLDHKPGKDPYRAPESDEKGNKFDVTLADAYSIGALAFILLTGEYAYKLPVDTDKNFCKIFHGGKTGLFLVLESYGKTLSDDAVDFIAGLMTPEVRRWSIQESILHPFVNRNINCKPRSHTDAKSLSNRIDCKQN
mmetsp:Transcript_18590/g.45632  ORF Transcript_18590/g.45632 Transcript_18590/m.45632 type:complete len:319 (+) Transcript_18590:238-1194(+)